MNKQTLIVVISSVVSLLLIFTLIQANRQQTFRVYNAVDLQGHESFAATGLSVLNVSQSSDENEENNEEDDLTHPLTVEEFEALLENGRTYYVSADILYLREGPGYDYASLATLRKNDSIVAARFPGDQQFGVVQVGDVYGFLDFSHLSETEVRDEEDEAPEETDTSEQASQTSQNSDSNQSSESSSPSSSDSSGSTSPNRPEPKPEPEKKEPVITKEVVTETTDIPYEVKKTEDPYLLKGKEVVTQEGRDGTLTIKKEITYTDGKKSNEKIIEEKRIDPIPKKVTIGTAEGEINGIWN